MQAYGQIYAITIDNINYIGQARGKLDAERIAELTAKLDKAKEYLLRILVSDCDFARIDAIANEALEELDK